jgi:cyclopropane fatty-acyl-phospholipid synthase-like methyltransferase
MKSVNSEVEKYYDDAQTLYNLFWSRYALHYGFWDKDTKKLSEAIDNTNRFVSELLGLQKDDFVLDAGCGVGGSSIFMARNFGVKTVGIALSQKQIKQARKHVTGMGLGHLVDFEVMDFCRTKFKDNTFTKILGIESACYAHNKLDFLKEAYRILKPGGKIVIADGFLSKSRLSRKESEIYNKCIIGWGGDEDTHLLHRDGFKGDLMRAGFRNINFFDKTDQVIRSSQRMARYGYLAFPFTFLLSKFRLIPKHFHLHTIACLNQRKAFHRFALYGVFVAEK